MIIPEYCSGVEIERVNRKLMKRETVTVDCHKIVNGKCTVWENPCEKMGIARGGFLGCAFSPLETRPEPTDGRKRVGQQKQTKRRR